MVVAERGELATGGTGRCELPAPKMRSTSMMSLDEILNFHWEVSLGDEKLTYEELQALAELKSPLVNVRGKWVTLNADEINAALEFWKKKGGSAISAREAVKMAPAPRRARVACVCGRRDLGLALRSTCSA